METRHRTFRSLHKYVPGRQILIRVKEGLGLQRGLHVYVWLIGCKWIFLEFIPYCFGNGELPKVIHANNSPGLYCLVLQPLATDGYLNLNQI